MGGTPTYGYDLRYQSGQEADGEFLLILRFLPDGSKQVLDRDGNLTRTLERARESRSPSATAPVWSRATPIASWWRAGSSKWLPRSRGGS